MSLEQGHINITKKCTGRIHLFIVYAVILSAASHTIINYIIREMESSYDRYNIIFMLINGDLHQE